MEWWLTLCVFVQKQRNLKLKQYVKCISGSLLLVDWSTICKTVCPMLSDHCPVCLSVWHVGVLWPNSWMDQGETWRGGRPRPKQHCVRRRPAAPPKKGHSSLHFSAHVYYCQTVDGSRCHLVRKYASAQATVLDGDPAPPRKGAQHPHFSAHVYCGQTVDHLSYCWALVEQHGRDRQTDGPCYSIYSNRPHS